MKDINLLPENYGEDYLKKKRSKYKSIIIVTVAIVCCLFVGVSQIIYINTVQNFENVQAKFQIEQYAYSDQVADKLLKIEEEHKLYEGILEAIKKPSIVSFDTVSDISGDLVNDVWLTKIAVDDELKQISLSGVAESREDVVSFFSNLENEPEFSTATINNISYENEQKKIVFEISIAVGSE